MRSRRAKEQLKRLREDFGETSQGALEEPPGEDKKLLDQVVGEIKNAADEGEEEIKLSLEKDVDLKIEAPDVLALQTPKSTLHKSFSDVRFQEVKKSGEGLKLRIEVD